MNITEAFRALEALNEDTFSVSDDGINKLSEFEQNDDLLDEIPVIDADADTEDDLQDSYVGKVILDCTVCHSKLYKSKDKVTLDDAEELANVGEECPYCYNVDGFKVIGEVASFDCDDCDTEDKKDIDEPEHTEDDDEEINESLLESINSILNRLNEAEMSDEDKADNELLRSIKDKISDRLNAKLTPEEKSVLKKYNLTPDKFRTGRRNDTYNSLRMNTDLPRGESSAYFDSPDKHTHRAMDSDLFSTKFHDNREYFGHLKRVADKKINYADRARKFADRMHTPKDSDDKWQEKKRNFESDLWHKKYHKNEVEQSDANFDKKIAQLEKELANAREQKISNKEYHQKQLDRAQSRINKTLKKEESLNESPVATLERPMSKLGGTLSNVLTAHKDELSEIATKDEAVDFLNSLEPEVKNKGYLRRVLQQLTKIPEYKVSMFLYNIILKGDGMGVEESFKPTDSDEPIKESVENIEIKTDSDTINVTPEGDGTVNVSTEPKQPAEGEQIVPVSDETKSEITNGAKEPVEDEFDDIDIDEFDEDSFNELGESYLKNIYENVESFKVSDVAANANKLKLEGIIKFTSGNEKKTSFMFEALDSDKNNKVRFIGENTNLTRGKKAFTLKGKINEGKFISESFNYNYRAKNADGKSTRLYGTVRTNKGV